MLVPIALVPELLVMVPVAVNVSGVELTLIALACVETPAKAVPARMVAIVVLSIDIFFLFIFKCNFLS
jgi:amino acid permease